MIASQILDYIHFGKTVKAKNIVNKRKSDEGNNGGNSALIRIDPTKLIDKYQHKPQNCSQFQFGMNYAFSLYN